jgi:hypothetical protein
VKLPSADITRQAIGLAGLTFALAGVISGHRAVVWLAMVFLAVSVAIRVTLQIRRRRSE